jgi:hypothetical protein
VFAVEIRTEQLGNLEISWAKRIQYACRQKQSEPQGKGKHLWFKEAVFNEVMCTGQESAVGRFGTDDSGNPSLKMARGNGFNETFASELQPNCRLKTTR